VRAAMRFRDFAGSLGARDGSWFSHIYYPPAVMRSELRNGPASLAVSVDV
jgi:hypothetical protein